MRLDTPFSADEYKSERSYDLIPPGWYVAKVTEATLKETKAGTGQRLAVRHDIIGPTQQGRVVFSNFNMSNPNAQAEKIGREQLSELMRAIGLPKLHDTDELIGGICQIKIDVQKGDDRYPDRNEVKAWKVSSDAIKGPPVPPVATASSIGQRAAPPWAKK